MSGLINRKLVNNIVIPISSNLRIVVVVQNTECKMTVSCCIAHYCHKSKTKYCNHN